MTVHPVCKYKRVRSNTKSILLYSNIVYYHTVVRNHKISNIINVFLLQICANKLVIISLYVAAYEFKISIGTEI